MNVKRISTIVLFVAAVISGSANSFALPVKNNLEYRATPGWVASLKSSSLPACDSEVVRNLLVRSICQTMNAPSLVSLDGCHELSYDRLTEERIGFCVLHTKHADIRVKFRVFWIDRRWEIFNVRWSLLDLLPCDCARTREMVENQIRLKLSPMEIESIDGFRELAYDRPNETYRGECIVHTRSGDMVVKYYSKWADVEKQQFKIGLSGSVIPTCESPILIQTVENTIRRGDKRSQIESIDQFQEVSFDPQTEVRRCKCVAHTKNGEDEYEFRVFWDKPADRDVGLFSVKVASMLPKCDDLNVKLLLEQVIRNTPELATVLSIDGHQESHFEKNEQLRTGRCIAHFADVSKEVKYFVEWINRDEAYFQVRLRRSDLPRCDEPQVKKVLADLIRNQPAGSSLLSIDSFEELSFDEEAGVRKAKCIAHLETGDLAFEFFVRWLNRDTSRFQVDLMPRLPKCDNQQVAKMVENLIRGMNLGAPLQSIDGLKEVSFDEPSNVRRGECIAHTKNADVTCRYSIYWVNRVEGRFEVRVYVKTPASQRDSRPATWRIALNERKTAGHS